MRILLQILLIFTFTSCFNSGVKVSESDLTEKHWRESSDLVSLSAIVDSIYSFGYDSSIILLPDSNLLVELYLSPTIIILDSNGKAVGVSVCNAHFPDFNEKVIKRLYEFKFDEDLNKIVQRKISRMATVTGEKFEVNNSTKFTVILGYVQTKEGYVEKRFFDEIRGFLPTDNIDLRLLVNCNYQELMFNDFNFQKKRILHMQKEEGAEFPKSVLEEFGIR